MRDDQQLDLFAWKPVCQVLAFPHDRLFGRARRIIELRLKSSPEAMDRIWKKECDRLDKSMEEAGISVVERDHQLDAFTDLVRACIADADGDAWGASGGDAA